MAIIDKLENIANAVRNKTGESEKLTLEEIADKINLLKIDDGISINYIKISNEPNRIIYLSGETFDPTGIEVVAGYYDNDTLLIEHQITGYTYSPQRLTDTTSEIVITYAGKGEVYTTKLPITVLPKLEKIEIIKMPDTIEYIKGQSFNPQGMIVIATYSDNSTEDISTQIIFSPSGALNSTGEQIVTISFTKNYENYINIIPSVTKTCLLNITVIEQQSFDWGDQNAIGDSTWWANLKSWIATASVDERTACIGKTKLVSLSTAVLGGNAATMLCIGADEDGTETLTFQTKGVLPTSASFGSSAVWSSSTARTTCQNFYNYCSAKDSIKTVSKGTCASNNSSRKGKVAYNDETVWLLSERELGLDSYSSISASNSTTSNAECTYGQNAPYSYYISQDSRIKYKMNADGSIGTTANWYWTRSRYADNTSSVCAVGPKGGAGSSYYYKTTQFFSPAFVIG